MRPSPLILKDYFTIDLSFSTNSDYQHQQTSNRFVINSEDLDVKVEKEEAKENSLQRECKITIKLKGSGKSPFPYLFSITLVGIFEIAQWWPKEKHESLFSVNAPSLLYSAARETIAVTTGHSKYPKTILPSITFADLPEPTEKEQNTSLSTELNTEIPNFLEPEKKRPKSKTSKLRQKVVD